MKKTAVITVIGIFVLITWLCGCAKTEPQASGKAPSPLPTVSGTSSSPVTDMPILVNEKISAAPIETDLYPIDNTHIPKTTMLVNEANNGKNGLFYLGMTRDDVTAVLKDNGINNYDMTEITNDEEAWDWGNYVINVLIYSDNFQFFFDKQNYLLYRINISGDNVEDLSSAQSGLKLGDAFDEMLQLYGNSYKVYETDDSGIMYEYKLGNHYFQVCFLFDVVFSWGISEYAYSQS